MLDPHLLTKPPDSGLACRSLQRQINPLGDHWKLEAETRWFIGIDGDNLLNSVRDDSYLTVRLRRYF